MRRFIGILLISFLGLTACTTEVDFPAGLVTESTGQDNVAYSGTLKGRLDGSSSYSLVSEDGSDTCTGSTSSDGTGVFTCTSGQRGEFSFPKQIVGKRSATNTGITNTGIRYAFGWGRDAELNRLRELVPPAQ